MVSFELLRPVFAPVLEMCFGNVLLQFSLAKRKTVTAMDVVYRQGRTLRIRWKKIGGSSKIRHLSQTAL